MFRKAIYLFTILFFASSCAGTWDSVKRGLTGQKKNSTDEFLVEKKDPLVLPPNYEDLPTPDNSSADEDEIEVSSFEKTLSSNSEEIEQSSSSTSSEESILEQIRKQ